MLIRKYTPDLMLLGQEFALVLRCRRLMFSMSVRSLSLGINLPALIIHELLLNLFSRLQQIHDFISEVKHLSTFLRFLRNANSNCNYIPLGYCTVGISNETCRTIRASHVFPSYILVVADPLNHS